MSAIYYDQGSDIKAKQCKTIVTFDTTLESKILDAGNLLILLNLQKPWTIACKDVSRVFEIEYSTYRILNRSELCKCSLTTGNYLLSYTNINCGNAPEARDSYFTTYYSFNNIVLDIVTEKFDIQVDENTRTQAALLHNHIPGYDLKEITTMECIVQVIMIIVCIAVYSLSCIFAAQNADTIFKYFFPFLLISHIIHISHCTDLFVEVTNITKGNSMWAHFTATGCFPLQMHILRLIQKEDVQIETFCCIFKCMRVNWSSIIVTGISGTTITMPDIAHVSIFTDNDLTHITDDHLEIKLIARLLNQIYVIQPPMLPPKYDDAPPDEYEYSQSPTSTDGARPSAPQFPEHLHSLLTCS